MRFRRATTDDAEAILRLWRASDASMGSTDEVSYIRQAVASPAAAFVLAVDGDEIVGTLIGTFDGWRGHMYRLIVDQRHRRQGVARELVRQVEHAFTEWGVRRVYALVETDRPVAAKFWTSVGYPADTHVVLHPGTLVQKTEIQHG